MSIPDRNQMFREAVAQLHERIARQRAVIARLSVNSQLTPVRVAYSEGDRLEIRNLPPDAPPVLIVTRERVFFDAREREGPPPGSEVEAFYQLYHTWDPRAIARALEPGSEEASPDARWSIWFRVFEAVPNKLVPELLHFDQQVRHVQFVVEEGQLAEFSQWDLAPGRTLLTLDFRRD